MSRQGILGRRSPDRKAGSVSQAFLPEEIICRHPQVAGGTRLLGGFYVYGFQAMTLFVGGMALLVFSGLIELHILKSLVAGKAAAGAGR